MNSMNNIISELKKVIDIDTVELITERQFAFDVEPSKIHSSLIYLKTVGFSQLSILTCIDWIKDNKLQLVYILHNWGAGVHVLVRTLIDREQPKFVTITNIFPGAMYYEREVHEFFGVEFNGNEESFKPLFLELWDDLPPLRKDFDPQAYSDKKFPKRDLDRIYKSKMGGEQE